MKRREFISLIVGTAAWPLATKSLIAQTPVGKIGYLHPVTINPSHVAFAMLRKEWQRLGYVDGETLLARSAEGDEKRIPSLVRDLIDKGVNVLVVVGAEAVRVSAEISKTIPIVAIEMETDPVQTGLIASYARPGGNVTGLFLDLPSLATKWIELMREAVPGLERIAFGWQRSTGRTQLDVALGAARVVGVETVVIETDISADFTASFAQLTGAKRTGIILLTFPGFVTVAARYANAAQLRGFPYHVIP